MNENLNPNKDKFTPQDMDIERALRPLSFDDFAGQDHVLENLKIFVAAANQRGEALDHALLVNVLIRNFFSAFCSLFLGKVHFIMP
jgi:Holliday junction resolvasome RuvABC ATP-dependent DNA helicase subunit